MDSSDDFVKPTDPVTQAEFTAFRHRYIRRIKKVEQSIADCFEALAQADSNNIERTDEAVDHAERAERAVRRLRKEYDGHEHE